jgi:hypothetical protein
MGNNQFNGIFQRADSRGIFRNCTIVDNGYGGTDWTSATTISFITQMERKLSGKLAIRVCPTSVKMAISRLIPYSLVERRETINF